VNEITDGSIPVLQLDDLDEFNKKWHKAGVVTPEVLTQSNRALDKFTKTYYDVKGIPVRGIMSHWNNQHRGLKIIEFNPTELCNRTCHFCPRHDPEVYPNQNLHMTEETVQNVVDDLVRYNYEGQIMFSGFGEPLLNRNILKLIKICSDAGIYTEMTTNADKIFKVKKPWYKMQDFVDAGLTAMHIDIYDDTKQYNKILKAVQPFIGKIRLKLTPRFVQTTSVFNNRAGKLNPIEGINPNGRTAPCFAPSVKAFIDWDGTVQMCCHDWDKTGNFGNVNEQPFSEIWNNEKMNKIRSVLMFNKRQKAGSPCDKCSTGGNRKDSKMVEESWVKHYKREKRWVIDYAKSFR